MGNPYKIKRYDFRSDTLNLTPGYRVISQHFWPVYEHPNNPKKDWWYDFDTSRGRVLYESPTKTDTVYFNTPDKYIDSDHGIIPIGTTKNQDKAKKGWYQWLNFSKPANKGAEKIKRNELKKEKGMITKHQQGGQVPQQNNLEQQIIQLVQAAAQGDQKATQQIEQIMQAAQQGNQQAMQIAQMIQQVIQAMQQQGGQQKVMARYGTKLKYLQRLRGICPEGEELVFFEKGGKMCKACQKKAMMQKGGTTSKNAVENFKQRSKAKMPTTYDGEKHEKLAEINAKGKATPAQKDSLETYQNLYKKKAKDTKIKKYNDQIEQNACGSKLKKELIKHQDGGKVKLYNGKWCSRTVL